MVRKNAMVKSNLFLGLGLSLFLLILTSLASYISIKNLIKSSELLRKNNHVIENLNMIENHMKDAETVQRGFIITGDERFLETYNDAKEGADESLSELASVIIGNPKQTELLSRLEKDLKARIDMLDSNLRKKKDNIFISPESMLAGKKYMDDTRKIISSMKAEEKRMVDMQTESLNSLSKVTPSIIIISALLALGITLFFYRKVMSDFNEKVILQKELEAQNRQTEDRIVAIEKVAAEVSGGNYKIRLDAGTKDSLGSLSGSLNKMTESLGKSFGLLEEKEWFQSGVASLNNEMVGERSMRDLADAILVNLAAITKSSIGALYILQDDGRLHLTGSYAPDTEKMKQILNKKEGIPGQCLHSEKYILLTDIPTNESTITYGSGHTKPKSIICVPILGYNRPIGVLEFGSLHQYTTLEIEFLNYISENVGIAINSAESRKRMRELLEETQAQSEELQSQQSELENINAELEAQAQKLQASEEELRVQQEELMESNQQLEERTSLLEERNQMVEERNVEIQLKSKELESSSKYKSEFLANMSHELRTPLNSILLLSKLMSDSADLEKEYVEYADVIQSSGQGLLSLIDEILDLSKIESGKMELDVERFPVKEIVSDIQSMFLPMAKSRHLALNIHVEDGIPESIYSDKMRLEQVLKNLISNAIKFTSEGSVTLRVSYNEKGNKLLFSVKDTGIGIAPEKQALIFEAFKQADGSTRRKFGGTGLGLSISRELTRLLKGTLSINSKEGEGSEFIMEIPVDINDVKEEISKPEIIKKPEPLPQPVMPKKERFVVDHIPGTIPDDRQEIKPGDKFILIVEDDTVFAQILLDYTREKNYKGIVAVRGDEGVEMALKYKPRAILLDIQLPVLDGWQVMEVLKSNPETKGIPVHIMSSLNVKRESLLKGAVDFIDKPFALDQMKVVFEKLENALTRHPKKVLIVEENNQHAKALSYFLSVNNITSLISRNLNESVTTLQAGDIDCVILDMGMQDKLGYQALESIKDNKGLENLPIIVFTGKALSIPEQNKIKKYADSIVVKTAHSYQRILDEAGLFLHLVEEKNIKKLPESNFQNLAALRNVLENKTVLVADDDVRNIFSLTKTLETHKMNVMTAIDGKEALKILKENKNIDVVLMDMMMPEMDGYQTIREIRNNREFKKIPILAVTAKAMKGDREKCIAAGASDYISKPVDIDQLVSLLRVWLYDKI